MIGRKYDEKDWVHVSSRVATDDVLGDLRSSIEKWEAIAAYLRMFDDNTTDFKPLVSITELCGVCRSFAHSTRYCCVTCPLFLDDSPCWDHSPYREIYDFADSCERWKDFVDQCGELTIKYATDLIQYLKGLIKHIEENA